MGRRMLKYALKKVFAAMDRPQTSSSRAGSIAGTPLVCCVAPMLLYREREAQGSIAKQGVKTAMFYLLTVCFPGETPPVPVFTGSPVKETPNRYGLFPG